MYTYLRDANPVVTATLKVWWGLVVKHKIKVDCKMLIWSSHWIVQRTGEPQQYMDCTRVSSEKLRQEFELVTYLGFVLLHWDQKHLSQEASEFIEFIKQQWESEWRLNYHRMIGFDPSACSNTPPLGQWTEFGSQFLEMWKGSIFLGNVTKHSQISYLQKSFMVRTFTCLKWWKSLHQTGFKVRLEQRRDMRKFPQQEKWNLSAAHPM